SGNSKLLSLQGLLKVAMDDIVLDYTSRTNADNSVDSAYVLELIDIGIKLFNIAKLPITSSTNFFLFSDASAAKKKNLGWALSYAQKNSLGIFDLPFFAMGQHLSLTHPERVVDMGTAMEEMKTAFFPNGDPFTTIIKQEFVLGATDDESDPAAQQLVFNDDSNWLIAFKFGLLGSTGSGGGSQSSDSDDQNGSDSGDPIDVESEFNVQLSVLFNDPEMYGARIEVGGDAVKVFDGLQFEILYKKITESIGLFHTELALPSKFRKFKAGAAQITLPILALDIYTNGDFKIDLGFPYDLDFSRSFSIEVQAGPFPLLGSGGFYFGKLSGDTATGLPVTTRGIFDPVMVFGLGLEAGFGKSFEEGPLSASFKITLVGIVEGTIATFTPNEPTTGSSTDIEASHYYKIKGTLGIVGI
ncbi:MAG: hypothetical protein KDC32_22390, partial [Saprospiraceae bacterium]|nr:hypothetical protein [Saprospiraceae bacterium]